MYLTTAIRHLVLLTISLATIPFFSQAQKAYSVLKSNRPVDPARYDEIKGSPYLYKDWQKAEIVGSDGTILHDVYVNFNGLTRQLEMKKDGTVSEINVTSYLKVIVETDNGQQTFFRGIHPQFGAELICLPYDGQQIKLIKEFTVRKQDTEIQSPMNPTVYEKFIPSSEYYLMVNGQLSPVKIKKKKIIEVLGYKSEIERYLKQAGMSLNNEQNLVKLLSFVETDLYHQ